MPILTAAVTRDDIRAELDRATREALELSGDEFSRRYYANEVDLTDPSVARLALLVRLVGNDDGEPSPEPARRRWFRHRTAPSH